MNAQALHLFDDGGLTGVFLSNGFESQEDPEYGTCTSYHELFKLTEQVCVALAFRTGRLRGVEFQYIRKAIGLPRTEVARMFGRTELTIINWESKNKVPLEASLLIKQYCLRKFGYVESIEKILDQQGRNECSDEQITMRFDPESKQWTSNLHPAQQWATADIHKHISKVMGRMVSIPSPKKSTGRSHLVFLNVDLLSSVNNSEIAQYYAGSIDASEDDISRWNRPASKAHRASTPAFMIPQMKQRR